MIRRINTDENKANNRIRRNQTTERRSRRRENHVRTLKKELDENYVVRASVTVTSQEILYGYLVKVMRIASAHDMTYSDFSARTTRDEIRPIIYGSESDIIIGEHKDQNRGYKSKDKDHMKSLYELYGAYGTRTRDSVHELTCAVNSRMKYVRRIMTMTRKKRIVTDLCMFVLVVYDEWESRFVNMRARTSARKVKNTDAKNMSPQARRWINQGHGYIKLRKYWRSNWESTYRSWGGRKRKEKQGDKEYTKGPSWERH